MLPTPPSSAHPIRIVTAEIDLAYRATVRSYVDAYAEARLVAETGNGRELLALTAEHHPHLVLLDTQLSSLNSMAVIHQLHHTHPATATMVLSADVDDALVVGAIQAGARGYLQKGVGQACLWRAVQAVVHRQTIFSPAIAQRLPQLLVSQSPPCTPQPLFPDLTPCERKIAALLVQGLRNREIAEQLVVTEKTARNRVTMILKKLGVSSRSQALLVLQGGVGGLGAG